VKWDLSTSHRFHHSVRYPPQLRGPLSTTIGGPDPMLGGPDPMLGGRLPLAAVEPAISLPSGCQLDYSVDFLVLREWKA